MNRFSHIHSIYAKCPPYNAKKYYWDGYMYQCQAYIADVKPGPLLATPENIEYWSKEVAQRAIEFERFCLENNEAPLPSIDEVETHVIYDYLREPDDPVDEGIFRSINHYLGSSFRWQDLAMKGATDERIESQLSFELGIWGSSVRPNKLVIEYKGGRTPVVKVAKELGYPPKSWHVVKGKKLIDKIRDIIGIPLPISEAEAVQQLSLF